MNKVFNETLNLDTDKDYQQNYTCRQTNKKHIWGVTFTKEILNGKLHFLCIDSTEKIMSK